jgi:hypothetical protein
MGRLSCAAVQDLTDTSGLVALGAGAVALVALVWAAALSLQVRRLRSAQRTVLGDESQDLVTHAATLQDAFRDLHERVEEVAGALEGRMAAAEERLDATIAHRALVRYDAYGELSGHQSMTLALLDADGNGVVLSSIAHRETARTYCKQVVDGRGEVELSPEEDEAVRLALAGERHSVTLRT